MPFSLRILLVSPCSEATLRNFVARKMLLVEEIHQSVSGIRGVANQPGFGNFKGDVPRFEVITRFLSSRGL